jgi:beta-lactam-binding protein with PASTA domain
MNRLGEFWRERGTLRKALIVVVAAVVAFSIIGAVTSRSDDDTTGTPATTATEAGVAGGEKRTVPDVAPTYLQDALARLRHAGFKASISSVPPITRAGPGVNGYGVRSQSPRAGSRAPLGSSVRLRLDITQNLGDLFMDRQVRVTVPRLVGLEMNYALRRAIVSGLLVTVAPLDHEVERLVVTEQSEPPGSVVGRYTEITLSLG